MRILFFLFFLFSLTLPLTAQQMHFTPPPGPLNLPSEECYNIMQDSKGYIWICTENGLCRYNGNNLKLYNKENGLPEGAVYFISEDKDGVIHLITSRNRIMRIKNDSLIEEPFSSIFTKYLENTPFKQNVAYQFRADEKKNYVISTQFRTFKIDHRDFSVTDVTKELLQKSDANYEMVRSKNENYLLKVVALQANESQKENFSVKIDIISGEKTKRIEVPFTKHRYPDWRVKVCQATNGEIFFNIHNRLVKVDADLNYTIYTMPGLILSMCPDKNNGLWVGTYQNGVCYYKDVTQMDNAQRALEGYSVSGFVVDRERATWCSTLEKGIFYCNNPEIIDYSNISTLKKVCTLLKHIDNKVYAATEIDKLIVFEGESVQQLQYGAPAKVDLTDIIRYNNNLYVSSKGYLSVADNSFHWQRDIMLKGAIDNVCTFRMAIAEDLLCAAGSSFIYRVTGDSVDYTRPRINERSRVLLYDKGKMYIGCMDGIRIYDLQNQSVVRMEGIKAYVTGMIKSVNDNLWIATKEGLYVLKNNTLKKIESDKIGKPDLFFDLMQDKNGTIWGASNNGLLKINERDDDPIITKYNLSNGLLSDNIKRITANDRYVYLSTTEGICRFPIDNNLGNNVAPPIFINSVIASGKEINLQTHSRIFPHNENSFDIRFDALTYKKGDVPLLMYKLSGQDDSMRVSMVNDLHFENLPPDEYTLTVYALNNDGVKSLVPATFRFVIEKPFWQTIWFISICVIVFFTALFFSVKKIIKNIRWKEEEKTRINKLISESQLSALQAQMNPHFIFNAINSIQNYILKKEEKEAYDYLAKFSKLIRMVLNNSRESTLPLYQELETLKLYIELEKLRFKNSFEFQLSITEDINEQELSIPTMLVQPYVENAIWHGLMNLDDERVRVLKIALSIESDLLKIVVEDNGVGRSRSYEYKKESVHNPVGMKLTEQRLDMISKVKEYEGIRVTIIDVYDREGKAAGTKVELFLPLII